MTSVLDPAIPAGAYDEFLPGALERARTQQEWTPADGTLPALFIRAPAAAPERGGTGLPPTLRVPKIPLPHATCEYS